MESVTLIASRTIDHIHNFDRREKFERPGGPAFYCKQAMEVLGYKVHLVTASRPTQVSITIRGVHESIRIDRIPKIKLGERLPSRNIVLSPILSEFKLRQLADRRCCVFLDAQGYIRTRGENQVQGWSCSSVDLEKVIALKVNLRESGLVSEEILDLFRERILLVTHGKEGVEVWDRGKCKMIRGKEVLAPDTLGAGDTFFGSFVAVYLETENAVRAAKIAITKAEQLLKRK